MTAVVLAGCAAGAGAPVQRHHRLDRSKAVRPREATLATAGAHHYLYVFPDQAMYVYDIDHGHRLVQRVSLPGIEGIRGVAASPRTHMLYISHGGDAGTQSTGGLLAYDLLSDTVAWDRSYARGVDSLAIDPAAQRLYMPDGELSTDGTWSVIDARTGAVTGHIEGGEGPHNTIVGPRGRQVYLGGRSSSFLDVASTATNRVTKRIGPLRSSVRPFTINGAETLAFTTATGALGFQVSSIRTGRVLYTAGFGPRFRYDPARFSPSAPSHGISLSPNQRQLWVIDAPNDEVHVFDVAGLPRRPPRRIADIRLAHGLTGAEAACSYDCQRDGWLLHSRSGCFVYVGDSGEVISTVSRRQVAFLPALRNTRKYLEIDWQGRVPVSTTSRSGLGYVKHGRLPPSPRCR
jgi:DNA-binding beta-propeller fold protein YncE